MRCKTVRERSDARAGGKCAKDGRQAEGEGGAQAEGKLEAERLEAEGQISEE